MIIWDDSNGVAKDNKGNYTQVEERDNELFITVYNENGIEINSTEFSLLGIYPSYEDEDNIEYDENKVMITSIDVLKYYT